MLDTDISDKNVNIDNSSGTVIRCRGNLTMASSKFTIHSTNSKGGGIHTVVY